MEQGRCWGSRRHGDYCVRGKLQVCEPCFGALSQEGACAGQYERARLSLPCWAKALLLLRGLRAVALLLLRELSMPPSNAALLCAGIAVLALCLVVGFSGYRHQVSKALPTHACLLASVEARKCCACVLMCLAVQVALEQAGNPGLSDDAARERLDRYFSLAGKNPRAAVRKTGKETRHSLNSYLTSLSTQKNSNAQEHGNVALTDEEAGNDLNAYFSRAGKDAHASVRKSDTEARQSLNAYISTLDSDAALGKRFCTRHPERCGKAARAEKAAAQAKAARAAAQAEAVAIAKKEQAKQEKGETEAQKLLSRDQAPATVAAPTAAASSHGKAARLGDDVMDLGATKAADDGDLHVKGADVNKYMFTKDGDRGDAWLKTDAKVGLPQLKVKSPLSKLSVADEAELAKCNVPEPRPAYCRLLMDVGMDPASVKTSMPDRGETECKFFFFPLQPVPHCLLSLYLCVDDAILDTDI